MRLHRILPPLAIAATFLLARLLGACLGDRSAGCDACQRVPR